MTDILYKVYRFYVDGFRSMTVGRVLWTVILINKKIETEKTSFANGGPYKTLSGLSCKAGGLQRRRALKSCILGVSSHHWATCF